MGRQSTKNNSYEFRQYEDRKTEVAARIKERRFLMGLLAKDVYEPMGMNPGQYTRIEQGELNGEEVLKFTDKMFNEWRRKEIKRLEAKIKYLKSL